jgi:2-iminobutanoate/2-iminopropanoate deaminase
VTPAAEVRNALAFIAKLLKEAGSGLDRVVQVSMLITDRADYAGCNAEYVRHFPDGLPARHTVLFGVPTEARVGFACVALAA